VNEEGEMKEEARMERKLAAILSADVKGYSRLMSEDELATVRTLTAYREVMTVLIQTYLCPPQSPGRLGLQADHGYYWTQDFCRFLAIQQPHRRRPS
jgi:hypothetical protein